MNPWLANIISFLAIVRSSSTISLTNSSNVVVASQPNSFDAFWGFPRRVSTSHGLKYFGSILTTTSPVSALIPTSSSPSPFHIIPLSLPIILYHLSNYQIKFKKD